MNNDKLLIIVLVLTLYLLCLRRSEGQDTEGDYVCTYFGDKFESNVNDLIDTKLNGLVDGNFADWVKKINNHGHNVSQSQGPDHSGKHDGTVHHQHSMGHSHDVTVTGITF